MGFIPLIGFVVTLFYWDILPLSRYVKLIVYESEAYITTSYVLILDPHIEDNKDHAFNAKMRRLGSRSAYVH